MNLYLVKRKDRWDWDEFDSMVVAAKDEKEAITVNPRDTLSKNYDCSFSL